MADSASPLPFPSAVPSPAAGATEAPLLEVEDLTIAATQPSPTPRISLSERTLMHVGGPVGTLVAAAHMAWGAANELLTMNGYRMLADQCDDPMLAQLPYITVDRHDRLALKGAV